MDLKKEEYLQIQSQFKEAISDLLEQFPLNDSHILVLGVSTSEVKGYTIGSMGSDEIAKCLFDEIILIQQEYGFHLAFQCCEHLNRSLVVTRHTADKFRLSEVSVVPVSHAGGAMASYAYQHLRNATIVEQIVADAAVDIGSTLIGMHLKPVAVPIRPRNPRVGQALVTMAKTRPKLIGGARAVYVLDRE